MNKIIKLVTATAVLSLLSACGGGGGGGGGGTTPVSDPKITVYSSYELASSWLTGLGPSNGQGVLQTCLTNASQIDIRGGEYLPASQTYTTTHLLISGSLNLPNAGSCSTVGISGQITGITFTFNGNVMYTISSLAVYASTLTTGYR